MKVDPDSQRGPGHGHQGVRFVRGVQRNSSDSLVNGEEQEGAHTCSGTQRLLGGFFVLRRRHISTARVTAGGGLTLAGLLSGFQAVTGGAHAGSGRRRGGKTQLGTVSIVVTAQTDSS